MVSKRTWKEFREAGLLWWVNMILHTFGWAIVLDIKDDEIKEVYPARVKFRGFDEISNDAGYKDVSVYLSNNASELAKETCE